MTVNDIPMVRRLASRTTMIIRIPIAVSMTVGSFSRKGSSPQVKAR